MENRTRHSTARQSGSLALKLGTESGETNLSSRSIHLLYFARRARCFSDDFPSTKHIATRDALRPYGSTNGSNADLSPVRTRLTSSAASWFIDVYMYSCGASVKGYTTRATLIPKTANDGSVGVRHGSFPTPAALQVYETIARIVDGLVAAVGR
jgi:hypothetical protein